MFKCICKKLTYMLANKERKPEKEHFPFFFFLFGRQPKNVPVADVSTEGVCMLFVNTLPYGTQYDHHNNQ